MVVVQKVSLGALTLWSACAFAGALGSSREAHAVPLPSAGVFAETFAQVAGTTRGPFTASDPLVATATHIIVDDPDPDTVFTEAEARAEARAFSPDGTPQLRSSSFASDNLRSPITVRSTASIVTHWIAKSDGSVVPLDAPLGIDGILSFDGSLDIGCCNGTAGAEAVMTLHTGVGSSEVYHSSLVLERPNFPAQITLTGVGDWLAATRPAPGSSNILHQRLNYDNTLLNLFSVTAGEAFAVELRLSTSAALNLDNGDRSVSANFFDTGIFDLAVSTAGVTLTRLDGATPTAVSEPSSLVLFLIGVVGLALLARRRLLAVGR